MKVPRIKGGADSRTRQGWGFMAGNTVALMVATAVASWALWPVYQSREFILLVAVSFCLGALIAILGAVFRWPAWILSLVTIGAYLVAGVPLAVPGRAVAGILPSPDGILELLAASALGWKRLVTIVLPVGAYQSLLVPAFILVLLCTVIGLSIALRARIGELAVLAPIVLLIVGIGLGPTAVGSPIALGLSLFVVLIFWLLWFRWRRHTAIRLVAKQSTRAIESAANRRLGAVRGLLSATLIIAVAIAAGGVAALAVPVAVPRDVLRARVQQPFDPRDYPSPLSGFRS